MLKWLVVFALVCVVFSAVLPGIGRMPGDFRFRVRDTEVSIPLGSTALFAACFWLIARVI